MRNSQRELRRQLEVLCNIWVLFENAKEAANAWQGNEREGGRGKGSEMRTIRLR
jgi:hypothetical protein